MTMTSMKIVMAAVAGLAPVAAMAAPMAASTYVMKAGAGDQYEIRSSKLLLASTHDPKLRDFAKEMVSDHTTSTAQVKAAALKSGLHPKPPHPDAKGYSDLAALSRAHGVARDHLYVQQQKMSHQKALMLQQSYAQDGGKPALREAAKGIVPVVQHHIEMLQGMQG